MIKIKAWRIIAVAFVSAFSLQSYAQTADSLVMSLEECLSYSKENNITLKQAKLQVDNYEVDESSAKSAFLPSVSGSIGQTVSNSPFSSSDNKTVYTGSYGIDASMTLYRGGENKLNLQQSKLNTQIANLSVEEQEDQLEVSITQVYIEILYAMEQIGVAQNSIALSEKTLERGQMRLDVGSINEADFAQLETSVATEKYNLVVAQTTLSNKYLQLKQLLEIPNNVAIKVDDASFSTSILMAATPSIGSVYDAALGIRPEIAASNLDIESALIDQDIAKAGYLPTISLSAGLGLSHSSANSYTFTDQMKNNYNHSIGVNVSIPIFSKYQNRDAVLKAQNNIKYANLTLEDESKTLYQTIETLYNNVSNADAMYTVSETKLKALEKSLDLVTQQYNVGMKNIIDLLTEQDDYREASQDFLESKYVLILNKTLLEYYRTGIIKL